MAAIVIRNIPDYAHAALRRLARERGKAVETLAREALVEFATRKRGGIDFARLTAARAALGLYEDGPGWPDELDDPKLSRQVLGLERPKRRPKPKK